MQVERRSVCYIAGTFVPAPLQYNIGLMPEPERSRCIESYRKRPALSDGKSLSFRNYLIAGFGEYLADLFLIPQNEKTMAFGLDGFSASALKRFLPKPDEVLVEAGIDQRPKAAEEYNSSFWYPRLGGIGLLPDGLADGLNQGFLNHEVVSIDPHIRRLICRNGQEFSWQCIVSSLPLKVLCHCVQDETLQELAHGLSHSTTIALNLGCSGDAPEVLRGITLDLCARSVDSILPGGIILQYQSRYLFPWPSYFLR
jgi:protoporphyrinogen oxidase